MKSYTAVYCEEQHGQCGRSIKDNDWCANRCVCQTMNLPSGNHFNSFNFTFLSCHIWEGKILNIWAFLTVRGSHMAQLWPVRGKQKSTEKDPFPKKRVKLVEQHPSLPPFCFLGYVCDAWKFQRSPCDPEYETWVTGRRKRKDGVSWWHRVQLPTLCHRQCTSFMEEKQTHY